MPIVGTLIKKMEQRPKKNAASQNAPKQRRASGTGAHARAMSSASAAAPKRVAAPLGAARSDTAARAAQRSVQRSTQRSAQRSAQASTQARHDARSAARAVAQPAARAAARSNAQAAKRASSRVASRTASKAPSGVSAQPSVRRSSRSAVSPKGFSAAASVRASQEAAVGAPRAVRADASRASRPNKAPQGAQRAEHAALARSGKAGARGGFTKKGIALAVVAALLLVGVADHVLNFNKAYAGARIGSIDCAGKTADQIVALLDETYGSSYEQKEVLVYVSEEAQSRVESTGEREVGDEDKMSVDQAREQRLVWAVVPETVSASFDEQATAQAAVEKAHGLSHIGERIAMAFQGADIDPVFQFGDAYRDFVDDVNATVGVERIDYDIAVDQGVCFVTEGQDGVLMDDADFQRKLAYGFLSDAATPTSFVAQPQAAPVRISRDAAQAVCDKVNAAIADGADFVYEGSGWNATALALGAWVSSKVEQSEGGWQLVPFINAEVARPDLLAHIKSSGGEDPLQISFEVSAEGAVTVKTDATGKIPLVGDALTSLDAALFGTADAPAQDAALAADGVAVSVNIASADAPELMSLDDALYYGVVGEITTFTTSYTHGTAATEARNYNIHLAADLLNNSVCPAGGSWSFHNTAGECNEARGFKEAGVIEEGTYSTAFGGGICQVATTVFNAVYEAGYYVDRRHNHTIYNSSYPAGRDAAVSWPDLDLIWSNDTASDVLMTTSYTEGTVSVTLWGVSPERSVSTYVSDWEAGDEYKTKYVLNTDLSPKAYRVKTKGVDGRSIYVERSVYDKEGNRLSFQRFNSTYDAVDEVIEHGEEYEVPEEDKDNADE